MAGITEPQGTVETLVSDRTTYHDGRPETSLQVRLSLQVVALSIRINLQSNQVRLVNDMGLR